jgi:glycogen(starch) synthase
MRILFWSETFWPRIGGVETLAAKLLPALKRRGHEFVVVSWGMTHLPKEDTYQRIPIHRLAVVFGTPQENIDRVAQISAQVADLKRAFAPDLIHINSYGRSSFFHLKTITAHPAPMLFTLHQALPETLNEPDTILGRLLDTADRITCCSHSVLEESRRRAPQITAISSVIHNALDAPPVVPTPLPIETPRLLCLGRLVREKGFDLAVTAFATIAHRFPNARLVIAGDGPERSTLEQQAVELGLARCVEFVGWVAPDDVFALINASTLVVIPSRWSEPFCLVALEAALMARPVVAARVGGLPEVVAHDETGLLVEKENSRALVDGVAFLLTHSEAARKMGAAARRRAGETFSWDGYVDAYDALYRTLTGQHPK